MGCHALLQGIFLTRGSNLCLLCLLHWEAGSLPELHLGGPGVPLGEMCTQPVQKQALLLCSPLGPRQRCCPLPGLQARWGEPLGREAASPRSWVPP